MTSDREKVAGWMMSQGYATGHGDTTEDLLKELEWQMRERLTQQSVDLQAEIQRLRVELSLANATVSIYKDALYRRDKGEE